VNVIIDEKGKILFFKVYKLAELPDIQEMYYFLKEK